MEIDFHAKLAEATEKIEKVGKEYAESRALSWQLQELRKVVLAQAIKGTEGSSMVEREHLARTSDAYRLHLEGTKEAIGDELRLRAEMDRWEAQHKSLISLCSLEGKKIGLV